MSAENKVLVRRAFEAFNRGDLEALVATHSPNYLWHGPAGDTGGPERFRELVTIFRTAFPDGTITIEEQLADGDKVITRSTTRGTHRGEFVGIAPTGRAVVIPVVLISQVANGKIVEEWEFFDQLTIFETIGSLPGDLGENTTERGS